jgi:ABC-type antimicrobial peptide transport system permease subunit
MRMVLGDVMRLIALGVVVGSVGALGATRLLGSFLFGVTPRDPWTMAMAATLLGGAALLAGVIPARRAATLQPIEALRED